MFKRNWKSAGLMWLVMLGLGIGFGIATLILVFLLIPAYIVLVLPAVVLAAIPGLVVFGITSIFASGPLAWNLGPPGGPAVLLPDRVCPTHPDRRLVQDHGIQR